MSKHYFAGIPPPPLSLSIYLSFSLCSFIFQETSVACTVTGNSDSSEIFFPRKMVSEEVTLQCRESFNHRTRWISARRWNTKEVSKRGKVVAIRRLNLKIERFGRWLLVDGLPRLASRFVDRRANARVYKYIAGACTAHTHSLGYATAVHSRGVSAALSLAPARFRFEEIRRTTLKKAVFTVLWRLSTSLLPLLFNRLFPSLLFSASLVTRYPFAERATFDISLPIRQQPSEYARTEAFYGPFYVHNCFV